MALLPSSPLGRLPQPRLVACPLGRENWCRVCKPQLRAPPREERTPVGGHRVFKVVVDHGHLADHLTGWRHKTPSESMKGALWHLPILAAGYPAFVFKQGCFAPSLCPWPGTGGGLLPLRLLTRRYRLLGVAPISHLGCWTTYRSANLHGGSAQAGWPHKVWDWLLTSWCDLCGLAEASSPHLPISPMTERRGKGTRERERVGGELFPQAAGEGCP